MLDRVLRGLVETWSESRVARPDVTSATHGSFSAFYRHQGLARPDVGERVARVVAAWAYTLSNHSLTLLISCSFRFFLSISCKTSCLISLFRSALI